MSTTECPVCLGRITSERWGVTTPCGHPCHLGCWDEYRRSVARAFDGTGRNLKCACCNQATAGFVPIFMDYDGAVAAGPNEDWVQIIRMGLEWVLLLVIIFEFLLAAVLHFGDISLPKGSKDVVAALFTLAFRAGWLYYGLQVPKLIQRIGRAVFNFRIGAPHNLPILVLAALTWMAMGEIIFLHHKREMSLEHIKVVKDLSRLNKECHAQSKDLSGLNEVCYKKVKDLSDSLVIGVMTLPIVFMIAWML